MEKNEEIFNSTKKVKILPSNVSCRAGVLARDIAFYGAVFYYYEKHLSKNI